MHLWLHLLIAVALVLILWQISALVQTSWPQGVSSFAFTLFGDPVAPVMTFGAVLISAVKAEGTDNGSEPLLWILSTLVSAIGRLITGIVIAEPEDL